MKILIYGLNFAPEQTGVGKYTGEMVSWLCERGHDLTVVTAPPYYPAWSVQNGYESNRYRSEEWNGATVIRCPLWVPSRPTGPRRLAHLLSYSVSSLPAVLKEMWNVRFDLIWVVVPTLMAVPGALLAARTTGARAWLHVQDLEVDVAFNLGVLPGGPVRTAAEFVERQLFRRFDGVSMVSEAMRARIIQKGVPAERCHYRPNWVDTAEIYPLGASNGLASELGIVDDRDVVVLYAGNMGKKQGLDSVVEAARGLSTRPRLRFFFCGDGAARAALQQRAQGLGNVQFLPVQPYDRLNELLNVADIHVLPQRPGVESQVMPSKLTGMMAAGGAVVGTVPENTEVARVVRAANGVICRPGDSAGLAAVIDELAEDKTRRERMGKSAREYACRHWSKSAILSRMEQDFVRLLESEMRPGVRAHAAANPPTE